MRKFYQFFPYSRWFSSRLWPSYVFDANIALKTNLTELTTAVNNYHQKYEWNSNFTFELCTIWIHGLLENKCLVEDANKMLKNEAVPVKTKRPLLNGAWSKRKNIYIHLYNIHLYKVKELINKRKFKVVIPSSCQDTYRSPSKKHQGTFNSDFMNAMIPFPYF